MTSSRDYQDHLVDMLDAADKMAGGIQGVTLESAPDTDRPSHGSLHSPAEETGGNGALPCTGASHTPLRPHRARSYADSRVLPRWNYADWIMVVRRRGDPWT